MTSDRHDPPSTAADVVLQRLRELTEELEELEPAVRADEDDAVHDARTTTRRLRTLLTYGAPLLQDDTAEARAALKSLGRRLGKARDAEVRVHLVEERLGKKKAKALRRTARRKHAKARGKLVAALDDGLLTGTIEAIAELPGTPTARGRRAATAVLPDIVAAEVARVDQLAASAGRARKPERRTALLHEVRKQARSARYAAETAARGEAVDAEVARLLQETATDVQDHIGAWRDLTLLADWIDKRPKRRRQAPGKRVRRLRADAEQYERTWPTVVQRLVRPDWQLTRADR
jgi:CHAD domain-containing protein